MNPVVHFEMPYDDKARAAQFYRAAFDWQMQALGAEMGDYVLATTTETDASGPLKPGAINGGMFPRKPDWPGQYPSVVIAVDDIKAACPKVKPWAAKSLASQCLFPVSATMLRLRILKAIASACCNPSRATGMCPREGALPTD